MAKRTLPGIGLTGDWIKGADDWHVEMNQNLLQLSGLLHLTVVSRTTTLPASPADGVIYINPESAPSFGGQVAIRDAGAWVYIAPQEGFTAWVGDETQFVVYSNGGWRTTAHANPACTAFLNYDQGFTSTWSKVPFNNAALDTTASFNTTTNKYVIPVDGTYEVTVRYQMHVRSGTDSAENIEVRAMNGATEIVASVAEAPVENSFDGRGIVSSFFFADFASGDELTVEARHDGPSGDQVISANRAVLTVKRIS